MKTTIQGLGFSYYIVCRDTCGKSFAPQAASVELKLQNIPRNLDHLWMLFHSPTTLWWPAPGLRVGSGSWAVGCVEMRGAQYHIGLGLPVFLGIN